MAFFIYSAIKQNGNLSINWRRGHFDHIESLTRDLNNRNELLYKYYQLPAFLSFFYYLLFGHVSMGEFAEFCRTIALYRKSGFTEQQAVADLAETSKNPAFRRSLQEIYGYLVEGYNLDQALNMARIFPELVISVARVGGETGHLDQVMEDAAIYIDRTELIKSTFKRSLIHPTITLFAILSVIVFWLIMVIPQIADLFQSLHVPVPIETEILIAIGTFFGQWWQVFLLVLLGLPILIMWLRLWETPRYWTDRFLWHLPVVGSIISSTQNAFFFQHLALTYTVGVHIVKSLTLVRESLRNLFFRYRVDTIRDMIQSGQTLEAGFIETHIFEPIVLRMVGVGERSGKLDSQMQRLSEIYYEKTLKNVDILKQTLGPLIAIVLGIFFAFFMLAALGPVYELITKLPA